ncbi:MAG TPA: S41 family peptidase [Opitutaceae bacterium]
MSFPRLAVILSILALVLAGGCATVPPVQVPLEGMPATEAARARENLRVFNTVWDLVNRKHYDPKTQGERWDAAAKEFAPKAAAAKTRAELYDVLNTMLAPLEDSHTSALSPERARERRTQKRARTGFGMLRLSGRWIVNEVLPESPADVAGVKIGWVVVGRNGQPLDGQPEFRPKEGDSVEFEFLDEREQSVKLTLVAQQLSIGSRQVMRQLDGGFVYLRFDEFAAKDRRWLSAQLKENLSAPGVVIDLRRNPGGETFSLGITIGEFFDRPVDCGTFVSRSGSRSDKDSWQLGSARYKGKVVVLVDRASGSAAEIFAAVLQDHERAKLVGRRTAGAVLASWFYGLPDGGELQLSREDYYAPKGRRIERAGVEPDFAIPRTFEDLRAGRDRDLEIALEILRGERS